ncbi:MAG: DUF5721 family protein [Lachnospiraceae bacterium]|nr:DUF5721 family protein [Lachnospiraceae bacterium]
MIMLKITNIKQFMSLLLSDSSEAFDSFLVKEVMIKTNAVYTIDGHLNKEFYSNEELEELRAVCEENNRIFSESMLRFSQLKKHCFSVIKGKKTPTFFLFEFYLAEENINRLLSNIKDNELRAKDISGLCLNIKYSDGSLSATTAVSLKVFTLDKAIEQKWDSSVKSFFTKLNISYETEL